MDERLTYPKLLDWKKRAKSGDVGEREVLRKGHAGAIKLIPGESEDRDVEFVISSSAQDRDFDTIDVDGWELDDYLKNPVVLWAHFGTQPPIGQALSVDKKGKKLRSVARFMPKGMYAFADMIFDMVVNRFLRATSVGFLPTEFRAAEDESRPWGFDFLKQILLEYSIVPVPSNPEALQGAKSFGIDLDPMVAWCEEVLDEFAESKGGLMVPRSAIERAHKIAKGEHTLVLLEAGFNGEELTELVATDLKEFEGTVIGGEPETKETEVEPETKEEPTSETKETEPETKEVEAGSEEEADDDAKAPDPVAEKSADELVLDEIMREFGVDPEKDALDDAEKAVADDEDLLDAWLTDFEDAEEKAIDTLDELIGTEEFKNAMRGVVQASVSDAVATIRGRLDD